MQLTIRNDTPNQLEIKGAHGSPIVLAPLEQRAFNEEDVNGFDLTEASQAGIVTYWKSPPSELAETLLAFVFGFGVVDAIVTGIVAGVVSEGYFFGTVSHKAAAWIGGGIVLLIGLAAVAIYQTKSMRIVMRILAQAISLIVILAIGLGLPAASVYFFANGKGLLADPSEKLFARFLQLGFIATASLLPVLLFFLYDRFQLNTLRTRLYRDLFRLDHGLKTRSEIDTKYGSQIKEAYGPEDEGRGRLARGTRWPVLVCAFVITMGWLASFIPVGEPSSDSMQKLLFPVRSVLTFGFLGAYFFGLQLIARRYARGDLKPKAYSYITIRILIIVVLSWVLEVFSTDSKTVLTAAFLIGIVPDEFFTLLKEAFRGQAIATITPDSEKHPLTRLEGIDLYDRARLEQEGIVNVESFAHHDLINLVLETQIPVPRLVDWMDQAILYLHIIEKDGPDGQQTARDKLRVYGIRTATDLLACWDAAVKRDELEDFKKLLGDTKPFRLEVVRDALLDDEWLERVQNWRDDDEREHRTVDAAPKTFDGKLKWALSLVEEKSYKEAIATFQEALEIRDDAVVRMHLAHLYGTVEVHSLRNLELSRENARVAFQLGQTNVDVLEVLIGVYECTDDIDEAIRISDVAIKLIGDPKKDKTMKEKLLKIEQLKSKLEEKKREAAAAVPQKVKDNGQVVATTA